MAHPNEIITIDITHLHIHHGITFHSSYKTPEGADLADNAALNILIRASAQRQTHLTFEIAAGGDAELGFFIGTTFSAAGTALFEFNMNQDTGLMTPSTLITHTPTITSDGVRILNALSPGGSGGISSGGVVRPGTEWILKRNTNYTIRCINRAGTAQPASIAVQWYEEEEAE